MKKKQNLPPLADARLEQLKNWLKQHVRLEKIVPIEQDASFRRYFRIYTDKGSYIVMDAPPEKEPCKPFVVIARGLKKIGVHTPDIYADDIERGFLMLSDFGSTLYLSALNEQNCDALYGRAMSELLKIQQCQQIDDFEIPPFDDALLRGELENFRSWFMAQHCQLKLSSAEQRVIDEVFELLIDSALSQPQVFTHRDYHSRNLMLPSSQKDKQEEDQRKDQGNDLGQDQENNQGNDQGNDQGKVQGKEQKKNDETDAEIGILDFQDAVWGPITYDLVSMIRDCYIVWPPQQVANWARQFYQQLRSEKLITADEKQFMRWFDLMGMQRHLKAIFIFARKYLRDHDPRYLEDIPRGLGYVRQICDTYPELNDFKLLLQKHKII